jgi:hypothetical protein
MIDHEIKNKKKMVADDLEEYRDRLLSYMKMYLIKFAGVSRSRGIMIDDGTVKNVLTYICYNRNIGIVLNDLTDEFTQLSKKDVCEFGKIFNKGRHVGITFIMLIHKFDGIATNIRNSTNNLIFTGCELAYTYTSLHGIRGENLKSFTNAINGIIKQDRDLPKEKRNYSCLLFIRDSMGFQYLCADKRGRQVFVGMSFLAQRNA